MDDETDWRKQLLVGLGVLVIVALLVGGVVGVIAIKAADVAGIGGSTSTKKDDERRHVPDVHADQQRRDELVVDSVRADRVDSADDQRPTAADPASS